MKRIAIIDYGGGNIGSVINAVTRLGYKPEVTDAASDVLKADAVFLPGVGAAGDTMKNLSAKGMTDTIKKLVEIKRPLFAVCVANKLSHTLSLMKSRTTPIFISCTAILQIRWIKP
ncbi:MAG: hypothetical protein NT082_03395 [Chloroflexi bacterium]|nr:hypothetical protein [Chloroflexota bacterium]